MQTRQYAPQEWAMTQSNLGSALRGQAARTAGVAGAKLLAEAVAAYRLALEVRTRQHAPQHWATTQNNRADARRGEAERTARGAPAHQQNQAHAAYQPALRD